jgi:hypothetical protein
MRSDDTSKRRSKPKPNARRPNYAELPPRSRIEDNPAIRGYQGPDPGLRTTPPSRFIKGLDPGSRITSSSRFVKA